jgi:sugar diacid utilization regulator
MNDHREHAAVTSLSGARDVAREGAMRALAARLAERKEELARRVIEYWRQEIVDYRCPQDRRLLEEEFAFAVENVDALVASLESGRPIAEEHFERSREIGARRVNQGVALESFLRAGRMWDRVCWEMVLSMARTDVPSEREAALEIAGRISDLEDGVATAATGAFLDEIADRGLLRHDLLNALLTGKGDDDHVVHLARRLHLRLAASYVVVVVRGERVELPGAREESPASRRTLDRIVEETRRHLRPSAGSLLTGKHNGDVVVLVPAAGRADLDTVQKDCRTLGGALGAEVSIGMSGWHEGRATIATAFHEAMDAVKIAELTGIRGHAVGIDEVLVDAMLRSSFSAQQILKDTLRPLVDYDASRNTALVNTLRAYLDARRNVTKSAEALYVNPNTVVYRLKRIKEVSGRDPQNPDDLLVLSLALKQAELRS